MTSLQLLPLLSTGGPPPLVHDIGFCLLLAGVLAVIFTRLKIPTIAAFLAAGVLVGPQVGQIVTHQGNIETIANLGLILLLFVIGLEIDVHKLRSSGKTMLLAGALQAPLCVGFAFVIAWLVQRSGWGPLQGRYLPIYVGFTVAFSSTLLVAKLLQEKFQMDTVVGRVSLGVLIFQDIWAIVVLALQPNFDQPDLAPVGLTLLGTGLLIVLAWLLAKHVLTTAFRWIAKLPELMLVAALGWCFGLGFLGQNLESLLGLMGLSLHVTVTMEMGALIAGATIAALPYAHEMEQQVGAVRDFFLTLFFVGLGMGIPRPDGLDVILLALLLCAVCLAARYLVFFPLLYYTGLDRRSAFVASTKMAQVSEFCLVIAYLGLGYAHIDSGVVSAIIFAFVITALLTPLLFGVGDALHDRLGGALSALGFKKPADEPSQAPEKRFPIVLLGFHRVASALLYEFETRRPDLLRETLVVDFNVMLHEEIRRRGATARYGDISKIATLQRAGLDAAKLIVCTVADDVLVGIDNAQLARNLRRLAPEAAIVVNAVQMSKVAAIYQAGAHFVFVPGIATATALLPAIDAALAGALGNFRSQIEERLGRLEDRKEVLS